MKGSIAAVVLAAGKSRRMLSSTSKITHRILGRPLIAYLLDSLAKSGIPAENTVLVCGENLEEVQSVVSDRPVRFVVQKEQLGTAHALLRAEDYVGNFAGNLLVTVGDNPYITPGEIHRLLHHSVEHSGPCTFLSAVFPHRPPPYGRVLRTREGDVEKVVEELDASEEELNIREVNSSIYLFHTPTVFPLLSEITNHNRKGEYYLTDIISILRSRGNPVHAVRAADYRVAIGINNRWELQDAEHEFNLRNLKRLALEKGVTILNPESTTVEFDVEIGQDTIIYPSTYIGAGTRIGRNCSIGPFAYLRDTRIPDHSNISFTRLHNGGQSGP